MNLDPAQKELLRESVLLQLHAARPVLLPLSTILRGVQLQGFDDLDERGIESELTYLHAKNLISFTRAKISHGNRRFGLTAEGVEYLESKGLA